MLSEDYSVQVQASYTLLININKIQASIQFHIVSRSGLVFPTVLYSMFIPMHNPNHRIQYDNQQHQTLIFHFNQHFDHLLIQGSQAKITHFFYDFMTKKAIFYDNFMTLGSDLRTILGHRSNIHIIFVLNRPSQKIAFKGSKQQI